MENDAAPTSITPITDSEMRQKVVKLENAGYVPFADIADLSISFLSCDCSDNFFLWFTHNYSKKGYLLLPRRDIS